MEFTNDDQENGHRRVPRGSGDPLARRLRQRRLRQRQHGVGLAAAAAKRACVILPDAASSQRWENGDRRPRDGFKAAGFETDIQNAQGDTNKYATIADQQLTKGCGVMLLVDLQRRRRPGRGQGQGRGHPGHRLRPPDRGRRLLRVVRQLPGRRARGPDDRRRPQGRRQGRQAARSSTWAETRPTATPSSSTTAPTAHEGGRHQAGRRAAGRLGRREVRRELRAGPHLARRQGRRRLGRQRHQRGGVIKVLDKNGLTVPVSGQDASTAGLQNVLLGKQTATVYKPFKLEAAAAVDLARSWPRARRPRPTRSSTTARRSSP